MIVEFKEALSGKINETHDKSSTNPHHTTFLKNFGTFTAAKPDRNEVSKEDYIIEEVKEPKKLVERQEQPFTKAASNIKIYHSKPLGENSSFESPWCLQGHFL